MSERECLCEKVMAEAVSRAKEFGLFMKNINNTENEKNV